MRLTEIRPENLLWRTGWFPGCCLTMLISTMLVSVLGVVWKTAHVCGAEWCISHLQIGRSLNFKSSLLTCVMHAAPNQPVIPGAVNEEDTLPREAAPLSPEHSLHVSHYYYLWRLHVACALLWKVSQVSREAFLYQYFTKTQVLTERRNTKVLAVKCLVKAISGTVTHSLFPF